MILNNIWCMFLYYYCACQIDKNIFKDSSSITVCTVEPNGIMVIAEV